jgi:putative ABC transport system permease protein
MMLEMIGRNIAHRPVRTTIAIIAIAVEVTLVVIIVGLTNGLLQDSAKRIEGIGADIMMQPPSSSLILAFSGAPMPIRIREKLEDIKGVKAVAPVLVQFHSVGVELIYGIELKSFNAVSGGFVFHEGHEFEGPDDLLVDDFYAAAKKIHVGDTRRLLDHDFRVVGIVEHGKGSRLFVPLSTLQELSGSRDKASIFFIKCKDPDETSEVMAAIQRLFPRHQLRPLKSYLSMMTSSSLPGLNAFVDSMILLAVVIGFLVIFLSMYTTVLERTHEIGILKSMGASDRYIVKLVLSEAGMLSGLGIVAGIGVSYLTRAFMLDIFPSLVILITGGWLAKASLLAVAAALAGALYPAYLAAKKDPIEALAYE